ncbi:MAG TPA: pyridoxamine 5'-phosphate oxidase family protein [Sphingobacteriaceae bacterium]
MKVNNSQGLEKLKELAENVKVCMLCTKHRDHLDSKPMSTISVDEAGDIWFFTEEFTEKVEQVEKDPQVCLAYSDPSKNSYLSVTGTASVINDKSKMEQLWNPILKAWFPQGLETPGIALLKVTPAHAEYWDSSSNKMVNFYKIIKAAVGGDKFDGGEHGKITL